MMRWIVVVLGLLSISLGFAQDGVPGNVSATAIAQDAFTLIWDEVEGASSYEVEIAEGMYYNFDQDLPSGWIIDNASYNTDSSDYAHTDPKYLALGLVSSISSPDLGDIREFSFFSGVALPSAEAKVNIEVSSDAIEWKQLGQLICDSKKEDITTNYKEYTYNIEGQGIHYFRINRISGKSSAVLIDDLHYTLNEPIEVVNSSAPVLRLDDLSPNTNYTVRVKANTDGAEFSNWLNVTTRPQHTSSAGNSSIAGGAATISLSPNGGAVSHDITINPSGEGTYHYTASVESLEGGYRYTIDDSGGGLMGHYTINHPGFTATDCTVEGGSVAAPNAGAGSSSFNIETVGKGAITITLMGGDTLPVSISAFEISYAAQGVCHVSWASAAESGMLGYYVKCSADSLYEHMSFISSLIPAHNESQPRSYQYIHENPPMPGWYWLVAAFMNGEEDIYGPVTQDMPYDPGVSNPVYQNSVLIYPNPFGSSANLRLNLKKDTQIDYKIYNIKGQLLKSGSLGLLPEGTTRRLMPELSIDGKPLNNGVYLLKLEGAGLDLRTRFVISK